MSEQASIFDKIERKDEWIAALRSGKYEQARGRLKGPDGYCCLGVYAEVVGLQLDPNPNFDGVIDPESGLNAEYSPIQRAFGGEEITGLFIQMNDSKRASFAEIADFAGKKFATRAEAQDAIWPRSEHP